MSEVPVVFIKVNELVLAYVFIQFSLVFVNVPFLLQNTTEGP